MFLDPAWWGFSLVAWGFFFGGGVFILRNRSTPSPPHPTTTVLELDGRSTFHPEEEDLCILTAFCPHTRASKMVQVCISPPFAVSSSFAVFSLLSFSVNSSNLQIHPIKSLKMSTFVFYSKFKLNF